MSFNTEGSSPVKSTLSLHRLLIAYCVLLWSCQGGGDPRLSPWRVAESVFEAALNVEREERQVDGPYVSQGVMESLQRLSNIHEISESLGLLSISEGAQGEWTGYYGFLIAGWPSLVQFKLQRQQGLSTHPWELQSLPFLEAYLKLSSLAISLRNRDQKLNKESLPWVHEGANWQGGLLGRDRRGRPLSSVVVAWIPPLVFVDGEPLSGVAERKILSAHLSKAFSERQRLANRSQATYTPHVSLALPAGAPATQVIDLMAWCEGAGAEQVSLLAQSPKGPVMVYLNHRRNQLDLTSPQRLLHAQLNTNHSKLTLRRTNEDHDEQTQDTIQWKMESQFDQRPKQASTDYFSLLERARQHGELDGLSIHVSESSTVAELLYFIDLTRRLDDRLPLTVAPRNKRQSSTIKERAHE